MTQLALHALCPPRLIFRLLCGALFPPDVGQPEIIRVYHLLSTANAFSSAMANFYNFPNDPGAPKKIPVKLPNAENALVEDAKLLGYLSALVTRHLLLVTSCGRLILWTSEHPRTRLCGSDR